MANYIMSQLNLPKPKDVFGDSGEEYVKKSEKEISKLQKSLSESYDRLNKDNNLLCTIYNDLLKSEKDGLGAASEIKEAISEIKKWREEMQDAFLEYATTGWGSGKTIEEMFNELFDPLLAALEPLNDVVSMMGLEELPFIGIVQRMITKFTELGRILSIMPDEIKDEARRQAELAKQAEKEAKRRDMEQKGANTTWKRLVYVYNDNSILKRLIDEIVECFNAFLEMLEVICSCAEIFAILMIMDKFKPVIDMFKLAVGDAITILENIKTLLKLLIQGKFAMLKFFQKLLWSKVEDISNLLTYLCSGMDLPSNVLISGCWMDIVSAKCDISSTQLSIDLVTAWLDKHNKTTTRDHIEDETEELRAYMNECMQSNRIEEARELEKDLSGLTLQLKKYDTRILPNCENKISAADEAVQYMAANLSSIYASELEAATSQDEYLNPIAKETTNAPQGE